MIEPGEKILLADDLIATGGTAIAGIQLLESLSARVVGCSFIIDLPETGGSTKLKQLGQSVISIIEYQGL